MSQYDQKALKEKKSDERPQQKANIWITRLLLVTAGDGSGHFHGFSLDKLQNAARQRHLLTEVYTSNM